MSWQKSNNARAMLELKKVSKSFDQQMVLQDVSFLAGPGEILGILAPEAAGKSTLLRLALTMLRPDQGEIIYNNKGVRKLAARNFGYIPQMRGVNQRARVIKYLVYQGLLNQLRKKEAHQAAYSYLAKYDLHDQAHRQLGELNADQQGRIIIISAILHNPDILVVDEPFAGFSRLNESLVESLLSEYRQQNKTVLLATRQLERAESICDRVCLLNEGVIILNMTMPELRMKVKDNVYYLETADDLSFLKQLKEVQLRPENHNHYKISIKDKSFDARKLLTVLNKNIKIIKFGRFQPGLLYIYTRLVKNLQRAKK